MTRPLQSLALALLVSLALMACAADSEHAAEDPGGVTSTAGLPPIPVEAFAGREIFEPQLVIESDGTLLMIWREKGEEGFDLFSAYYTAEGAFSTPVRVNDQAGTVYAYPHDEMRPAVAVGPDGLLAVAWTDERAQIRAAFGREHGAVWEPSIRLDQADAPAYRSFTAAGIDGAGVLHAVWIDSRLAPRAGAEEPADLFYARVDADPASEGTEVNLTADQEASICGCCRPDLETYADGSVRAVFRNTTDDGFRDIFTISGSVDSGFSPAERVGPATWKLQGCPMSGPLGLADQVLWRDASSGEWVLKRGRSGVDEATSVFESDSGEWKMSLSPRRIAGDRDVVLVPGQPGSRLIERQGSAWVTTREDLPGWATSAASLEGALVVVGAVQGKLELEVRGDS